MKKNLVVKWRESWAQCVWEGTVAIMAATTIDTMKRKLGEGRRRRQASEGKGKQQSEQQRRGHDTWWLRQRTVAARWREEQAGGEGRKEAAGENGGRGKWTGQRSGKEKGMGGQGERPRQWKGVRSKRKKQGLLEGTLGSSVYVKIRDAGGHFPL